MDKYKELTSKAMNPILKAIEQTKQGQTKYLKTINNGKWEYENAIFYSFPSHITKAVGYNKDGCVYVGGAEDIDSFLTTFALNLLQAVKEAGPEEKNDIIAIRKLKFENEMLWIGIDTEISDSFTVIAGNDTFNSCRAAFHQVIDKARGKMGIKQ